MIPAAFSEASSGEDGLRSVLRSAMVLDFLGGNPGHLFDAADYGAKALKISDDRAKEIAAEEYEKLHPAKGG